MGDFSTIKQLLADVKAALGEAGVSLEGIKLDLAAYVARIQDLLNQILNGGVVTQAQVDELQLDAQDLLNNVTALRDSLKATDEANPLPL